jgi:hypothetical protein
MLETNSAIRVQVNGLLKNCHTGVSEFRHKIPKLRQMASLKLRQMASLIARAIVEAAISWAGRKGVCSESIDIDYFSR